MSGNWTAVVEVPSAGYCWGDWDLKELGVRRPKGDRPSKPDVGRFLTEHFPKVPHDSCSREYNPISETSSLFLKFASLDPTEEEVLAFANQYGVIEESEFRYMTELCDWRWSIMEFRDMVDLWNAAKSRDLDALGSCTKWIGPGDLAWDGCSFGRHVDGRMVDGLPQDDLPAAGMALLRDFITTNCKMTVHPVYLSRKAGEVLGSQVMGLTSALWIQIALAVFENREFRYCESCNEPFELTSDQTRSDRTTCSSPCRQKAYRRRQNVAQTMRSEGAHLRSIAKATGSDMQTIKKWVGEL